MKLKTLELKDYRNHKEKIIHFKPKGLLILGENGSGKTNIIEAIQLLTTGKPFKAGYDREAVAHNKKYTAIKGTIQKRGQEKDIRIGILIKKSSKYENASSKKVKINGQSKRIGSLAETVNSVLFSPLDMDLLTGSPSNRRSYLNDILEQSDKEYKKAIRDYKKARRQKNKILEIFQETGKGTSQLEYWNEKLLDLGTKIQAARRKLIDYLNENINQKLNQIDLNLQVKVYYDINPISEERLEKYYSKEIAATTSLIGPHRDDFKLMQEELDLSRYASRGQQRTLILCLKLCELEYLETSTGEKPILLLDDIFSELDEAHRKVLQELIGKQQTIITATERPQGFSSFPELILKKSNTSN